MGFNRILSNEDDDYGSNDEFEYEESDLDSNHYHSDNDRTQQDWLDDDASDKEFDDLANSDNDELY
jgi:hypothetical protein